MKPASSKRSCCSAAFLHDVEQVWDAVERSWLHAVGDAQHVSDSALRLTRCALLNASGLAVEEWPADLVVEMAPSERWSEGAMLAALQRLKWRPNSVIRAFNDVREDLSRGALAGLADDTDAEALLRLAAGAELARRDGVTALDAIVARAGGISTETAEAQALVASWLGPSELAKTVDDLRGVLPDRGHVAKKLHAALRVAEALEGEARRQQLDAIRLAITAAAGTGIGRILDAAMGRGDFEPGASASADGQRLAWVIGRWGLVPMISASLGFRREWDPKAEGEVLVAELDAIDMPDLREKRTAQFADTLADTLGPEAALSRVRAIGRPFLRAKGLARIARVRRDPELLDEAVEAASDHHDALACAAAATELARLSGDDAAREVASSLGGLIRAALEDPGAHEAWAWAALGKVMTQADCGALCDAMLRELQRGKEGLGAASEILAGILPGATPAILEATLAVAPALPWAMQNILQAAGAGLNAARLEELWLSHSDLANVHIRQSIAVPLARRGSAALADSAVDWCAHRALQDELANIVRDAPEPVARRAWEALLDRREEGPWLIAALKSGVRFSEERAALAAEVVGAAERSATIGGDAYLTYRVLVEGVLHAVPRGEAIGLRAARLAGTLIVIGPQADAAVWRADFDLGWRAQLAVRLPAGAERETLLAETIGIIEQPEPSAGVWATAKRAYTVPGSERQVKRDDFNRLLVQSALETTPDPQELASVLDSFAEWPLLLPMRNSRSGKPVDFSLASLCAVPAPTLRPIWARSLRVFATSGRACLARQLAFYAPLLQRTGGNDTARRVAQELLALPRWWP